MEKAGQGRACCYMYANAAQALAALLNGKVEESKCRIANMPEQIRYIENG